MMQKPKIPVTGRVTVSRHLRASTVIMLFAIFTSSCAGGGTSSEASLAVIATAESNQAELELSDDLARSELLDGATGQITSLGEVVHGDRAILVWYWAPN